MKQKSCPLDESVDTLQSIHDGWSVMIVITVFRRSRAGKCQQ